MSALPKNDIFFLEDQSSGLISGVVIGALQAVRVYFRRNIILTAEEFLRELYKPLSTDDFIYSKAGNVDRGWANVTDSFCIAMDLPLCTNIGNISTYKSQLKCFEKYISKYSNRLQLAHYIFEKPFDNAVPTVVWDNLFMPMKLLHETLNSAIILPINYVYDNDMASLTILLRFSLNDYVEDISKHVKYTKEMYKRRVYDAPYRYCNDFDVYSAMSKLCKDYNAIYKILETDGSSDFRDLYPDKVPSIKVTFAKYEIPRDLPGKHGFYNRFMEVLKVDHEKGKLVIYMRFPVRDKNRFNVRG